MTTSPQSTWMYEGKFLLVDDDVAGLHYKIGADLYTRIKTIFWVLAVACVVLFTVLFVVGLGLRTGWLAQPRGGVIASLTELAVVLLLPLVLLTTRALPMRYIVLFIRKDGRVSIEIVVLTPYSPFFFVPMPYEQEHWSTEDTGVCDTVRAWMRQHRDDLWLSTLVDEGGWVWDSYLLRCTRRSAHWSVWQTANRWRTDYKAWREEHERRRATERQQRLARLEEDEEKRRCQERCAALDRL